MKQTAWVKKVDSTPTQNSENLIESGGVYTALAEKQNTMVAFGTCATAAAEQNKVVTVSDSHWQLKTGSIVGVRFSNTNTYSATTEAPCTLNVNGSGAKAVYYNASVFSGASNSILGYQNRTTFYMYDGTYWVWLNMGSLDGNTDTVPSAHCATNAGIAAKAATCTNFTLAANSYVHILIQYANTYDGAITLNINSTGTKPVYINGSASSSSNKTLPAGTYIIYYDGTNYYFRTDGVLPGSIEKVNGHTVEKDVPSSATFADFSGATASAAGTHGYVPAPAAGDQNKVLKGGGAWATIPETANEMVMSSSDSRTVKEAIDDLGDVVTEFYLIIRPTFWTNSAPYLYTWRDSRVHADSYIEVTVENSSVDATADYIEYYKTQAGDGIVFKPNKRPTADLELAVTITNTQMHAASSIDADTVVTDAISGASSVDGALTVLNSNINTMVGTHSTDIAALKNDLGTVQNGLAYIVGDTNTTGAALPIGQFVYVKGHATIADGLRTVTAGIAANGSITTNNTDACPEGGLNAVKNKLPKSGFKNITIPAGGSQSETVLFDTPFPAGTSYAVLVTQSDQYAYADLFFGSTDRSVNGFKLNGSSNRSAAITLQVMWAAIPF